MNDKSKAEDAPKQSAPYAKMRADMMGDTGGFEDPVYWQRRQACQANWPRLKPQKSPCDDCGVVHGLYKEVSDGLAAQPSVIRADICATWVCHQNRDRVCRGNIDNVRRIVNERKS